MPNNDLTVDYSFVPDKNDSVNLDGANFTGDEIIYVAWDISSGSGIQNVDFYLDDPDFSGPSFHREGLHPYDFVGGASPTTGQPFDLSDLPDGNHSIGVKAFYNNGTTFSTVAYWTIGPVVVDNEPEFSFTDLTGQAVTTDTMVVSPVTDMTANELITASSSAGVVELSNDNKSTWSVNPVQYRSGLTHVRVLYTTPPTPNLTEVIDVSLNGVIRSYTVDTNLPPGWYSPIPIYSRDNVLMANTAFTCSASNPSTGQYYFNNIDFTTDNEGHLFIVHVSLPESTQFNLSFILNGTGYFGCLNNLVIPET